METDRLPTPAPVIVGFAASTLIVFLGICTLYGWYVGGRPGGWFEGKHLVLPLYAWGAVCAGAAGIVILGGLMDLFRSLDRIRSWRMLDWLSLGGALAIFAALACHFWVPWGLGVVYAIAGWRRGMWEG